MNLSWTPQDTVAKAAKLLLALWTSGNGHDPVVAAGSEEMLEALGKGLALKRGDKAPYRRLMSILLESVSRALDDASCCFTDDCHDELTYYLFSRENALQYLQAEDSAQMLERAMREIVARDPPMNAEDVPFTDIVADIGRRVRKAIDGDQVLAELAHTNPNL